MLKIISYLWSGCWHEWEDESSENFYFYGSYDGVKYTQKCKKCGARRTQHVR